MSLSLSLVSVVYCQIEVSATGRSLVQRSLIGSGVPECDCGTSLGLSSHKNKLYSFTVNNDLVNCLVMGYKQFARDMSRSGSAVLLVYFCQRTVGALLAYC